MIILSIQNNVETDEVEDRAAPLLPSQTASSKGRDNPITDTSIDQITMTEDQLLREMERLGPIASAEAPTRG